MSVPRSKTLEASSAFPRSTRLLSSSLRSHRVVSIERIIWIYVHGNAPNLKVFDAACFPCTISKQVRRHR